MQKSTNDDRRTMMLVAVGPISCITRGELRYNTYTSTLISSVAPVTPTRTSQLRPRLSGDSCRARPRPKWRLGRP